MADAGLDFPRRHEAVRVTCAICVARRRTSS
jgi:hypothetical protein